MHRPHAGDERSLSAPVLHFNLSDELRRLRGEPDWTGGRRTITLGKLGDLTVVLTALRPGARLDEHDAPTGLTIHVLEGSVRLSAGGETRVLGPGELLALEPGVRHAVEAVGEAAFLLTLAQPATR